MCNKAAHQQFGDDRDDYFDEDDCCERCGGEGYITAADGDGTDWGEDCYAGPLDAEIKCRVCKGTGLRQ